MGLFSRKAPKVELQIPDELALKAANLYGARNYQDALAAFGGSIDKIHTMYIGASAASRLRQPGGNDQEILDGFIRSLGATLGLDQQVDVSSVVQRTVGFLGDIAGEAGSESARYLAAIETIRKTYGAGSS